MAISKPFAYNVGGPISGTTQYGDLVVGNIDTDYSINYGGVKWWGGPDEELGYVVAYSAPLDNHPTSILDDKITLSTTYKGVDIILSNNNQTAFQNFSYSQTVLGETIISGSNQVMFSVLYTSTSPSVGVGGRYIGIGLTTMNYSGPFDGYPGNDTNSIGFSDDGKYYYNGAVVSTGYPTWTNGDIIDIAIAAGQYWWIRVNGGNWNNNPSANPTTFANGLILNGIVDAYPALSPYIYGTMEVLNYPKYGVPASYNFLGNVTSSVGFFRSELLTDNSFLNLANYIGVENNEPPFATTSDAVTWLNDNGYYTSYSGGTPLVTGYYVGGEFTEFSGISQNYLIKLNTDDSKDTSFDIGSGFNSTVLSVAIQSDGKVLAGGYFSEFSGISQNYLIRINSDGSKDTSFDIGSGFNSTGIFAFPSVNSVKVQSNGKILVGGTFSTFNGSTQNSLIRLNTDGSKDTSFDIGSGFGDGFGDEGTVYSCAVQSDGKILAGGLFSEFNGASQNRLIRLNTDGSKDTSFDIGDGFNSLIESIAIQSDGKILAIGAFSTFSGSSENYLIRLNSDGSKDSTFDIGTGPNGSLWSIKIQSDGKILVGGDFTQFNGSSQNALIRLNSDGSKDTSFDIGTGFFSNGGARIKSIGIKTDGTILAGGSFQTYKGVSSVNFISLNNDGSINKTFNVNGVPQSII
jgi:uncharacterized delta-60 repeat protein